MLDLNALLVFAKVVEANSFSAAARQLRVPVSTVSRRVAELEGQLGVRLLERSTRSLRLTDLGSEVLEHARRSIEISDAVAGIVSNRMTSISGLLRVAALPSISDTLVAPLVGAFQAAHPNVRVQVLVTERHVDQVAEGIDLAFRFGPLPTRVWSRVAFSPIATVSWRARLTWGRSQCRTHRETCTITGSWRSRWASRTIAGRSSGAGHADRETITFQPHFTMNDYIGLATALLAGSGIGDLPPVVQPELLRDGRLVEVMPDWRFRTFDLSLVHLGHRQLSRPVRLFKDFAIELMPTLFPDLPT